MSDESLPQRFSRHPLAWLAAYFAFGVIVRHFCETGFAIPLGFLVGLVTLVAISRVTAPAIVPMLFVLLGVLALQFEISGISENRIRRIYDEGRIASYEPVEVEGVVFGSPEPAFDGMLLVIEADTLRFKSHDIKVAGRVRMFVPRSDSNAANEFEQLNIRYATRIRAYCKLEREEEFRNPGVPSRKAMLDSQGIDAKATVKSPLLIENIGDPQTLMPLDWIYERRQVLISEFNRIFTPQTAGVLIASILGDKHFLDGRTAEVFRDGGTFHVLVISGLHITFIGGLAVWIVSLFSRRRGLQFSIATAFLWTYTLAVGAEVPVVRASLMFTVLLFSLILHRRGSQLNGFGACVLVLLVWRPSDLFTPSFQLTAVSVGAIVACAFPIVEKLRSIGRWMPSTTQPFPPNASDRLRRIDRIDRYDRFSLGAGPGLHRDGGVLDYHLDLEFGPGEGLVLYPHFYPYVVPGWFDKALRWRRARGPRFDKALIIAPSPELIARLPGGKIPDRDDFYRLPDDERMRAWRQVLSESRRMGDEFWELFSTGRLAERLQPL